MTDYSPSPELVEALRERGFYRADVYDTTRAAVAFRHPDGNPELVPWEQVRELVEAARDLGLAMADAALPYCFTPRMHVQTMDGDVGEEECGECSGCIASDDLARLRAALAPFTREPNEEAS